jgi:hypothetical protein
LQRRRRGPGPPESEGFAATLAPVLEGLMLSRYKGVDLSQTALGIARENLRTLACPVELTNAHLLDGFSEDTVHDAIYTSFALVITQPHF